MRLSTAALPAAAVFCLSSTVTPQQSGGDVDPATIRERLALATSRQVHGADLPVVTNSPDTQPFRLRQQRASRFNRSGGPSLASAAERARGPVVDIRTYGHAYGELPPALPVLQSDAVIRGTVTAVRAELSEDRRNVYSEFQVRVHEVFKQPSRSTIETGSTITVLREGGAVSFPTALVRMRHADETMPLLGKQYVLFLKQYSPSDPAWMIDTGYCLDGGRVTALDLRSQAMVWENRSTSELLAALTE